MGMRSDPYYTNFLLRKGLIISLCDMLIAESAKEQPPIREFSIEKTCFLPSFLFTVSIGIHFCG